MFSARGAHLHRFSPREPNFKKISDSAGKIHFGMFSARGAHLHRFSPREPNFKKFQIRPEKFILACSQLGERVCTDFHQESRI